MTVIDGKGLANEIKLDIKNEVKSLNSNNIFPKLAVIMVGNDSASRIYVNNKSKACEKVGIAFEEFIYDEDISQKMLIDKIKELNEDKSINGILLQCPIPKNLNLNDALSTIDPDKDVDGFNPVNVGRLCVGEDTFVSCTPYGIMKMFEKYNIELCGKHTVVIGRSNIVGKPLIQCLLRKNATVTVCHSKTEDLEHYTREADVLISAIGKPMIVRENMVKRGVVVIDVGISRLEDGKIVGDVDFDNVSKKASFITPVPGGVGPMTIAMLLSNVVKATKKQFNI